MWHMSIHDRDYMKGSSDSPAGPASSTDEKVEAFLSGFLQRNRRLLLFWGIFLALLIVAAIAMALLGAK